MSYYQNISKAFVKCQKMGSTSLVLIAASVILNNSSSIIKGGDSFSEFYSISALEEYQVDSSNMKQFLKIMIENDLDVLSTDLASEKESALFNLETASIFFEGDSSFNTTNTAMNIHYENKSGNLFMWMYSIKNTDKSQYTIELLSCKINLDLNDSFTILQNTKKSKFGNRTWYEKAKIPAQLSQKTVADSLAIGLAPFMLGKSLSPNGVIDNIKSAAQNGQIASINHDLGRWITFQGIYC
ncbi:hypothetical protein TRFO_17063 [Tritrichomonas foetus]|uniref:Uncharacterized protein n=1 Tax=Tritrichomonas foetus TaxID=1144522 RepID=A0A1J4KNM7_9EUKA|nr:hypothetical protein TRFO_17063 [Tritrichomonas foetus]|eukprot:OHT12913.1 hypothetical protein TRFO_17063 [Tritrichomonas foetus]